MSKRYVYWKTPQGTASRGDNDTQKHAPVKLLAELGESASLNKDGNLQWRGFSFLKLQTAIRLSTIVVEPKDGRELNSNDAWSIVYSAIKSVIRQDEGGTPIDPNRLIKAADAEAAKYFRQRERPYVLVSSLLIDSFPSTRITIGGCLVTPLKTRTRYPTPRCLEDRRTEASIGVLVKVHTNGRTVYDASERALRALDLLRGLWTLSATFGSSTIHFGDQRRKPLGVVRTGRIHTLHKPDGVPVDDVYWCDRDYVEVSKIFTPQSGWQELEKARRWGTTRLRCLTYRADLETLIVRYSRALDHTNHDVSFLQLWSLLEKITSTIGVNYERTVERVASRYKDRERSRQLLASLRTHRNQYVHASVSTEDPDRIVYLAKPFVDTLLVDLLYNEYSVKSLAEYAACLDLPSNIDALREKQRHIKHALRLRCPRSTKRSNAGTA